MVNSDPIKYDNNQKPPNIRYHDSDSNNTPDTLASNLYTNLNKSCNIIENEGFLFSNKNDLYKNTLNGTLDDSSAITDNEKNLLTKEIAEKCVVGTNVTMEENQKKIANQFKYLSCQLASARNRTYNQNNFDITDAGVSVKQVFEKFSNIKIYLIFIFFLTIYFLTQGFFSSFDVCGNIVNLVDDNNNKNWLYWIGLFLGILTPILVLSTLFISSVCGSISSLEKINITNNPEGVKDQTASGFKNIDSSILFLFLLFVYGFVAVIFTIKKESVGDTFYLIIVGSILFIISVFIYLFYTFTPFFSSGNIDKVDKFETPLKLYIDGNDEPSEITTNQVQIQKIQNAFFNTACVIFSFFILFMILGKSKNMFSSYPWAKNLLNGFFGASAILIIPIIWIFNLVIALKYFYIYPVLLLGFRFIRYFGMGILYILYNNNDTFKDNISSNLEEQLENFKDYTPSWNLIGIDLLKSLLNIFGYENIFSEKIVNDNNYSKNISSNKYVISSVFSYLFMMTTGENEGNSKTRIMVQGFITLITIIISCILLFGYYKI